MVSDVITSTNGLVEPIFGFTSRDEAESIHAKVDVRPESQFSSTSSSVRDYLGIIETCASVVDSDGGLDQILASEGSSCGESEAEDVVITVGMLNIEEIIEQEAAVIEQTETEGKGEAAECIEEVIEEEKTVVEVTKQIETTEVEKEAKVDTSEVAAAEPAAQVKEEKASVIEVEQSSEILIKATEEAAMETCQESLVLHNEEESRVELPQEPTQVVEDKPEELVSVVGVATIEEVSVTAVDNVVITEEQIEIVTEENAGVSATENVGVIETELVMKEDLKEIIVEEVIKDEPKDDEIAIAVSVEKVSDVLEVVEKVSGELKEEIVLEKEEFTEQSPNDEETVDKKDEDLSERTELVVEETKEPIAAEEIAQNILDRVFEEICDSPQPDEEAVQEKEMVQVEEVHSVECLAESTEKLEEVEDECNPFEKDVESLEAVVPEAAEEIVVKEAMGESEAVVEETVGKAEAVPTQQFELNPIEEKGAAESFNVKEVIVENEEVVAVENEVEVIHEDVQLQVVTEDELLTQKMQDLSGKIGNTLKLVHAGSDKVYMVKSSESSSNASIVSGVKIEINKSVASTVLLSFNLEREAVQKAERFIESDAVMVSTVTSESEALIVPLHPETEKVNPVLEGTRLEEQVEGFFSWRSVQNTVISQVSATSTKYFIIREVSVAED